MRYLTLATDYDGTLARHGKVDEQAIRVLERFIATGRKLYLVTGRQLEDLLDVFPHVSLFDWIVAENGGVLYKPDTNDILPLAGPPPEDFLVQLHARQIPVTAGRVIAATVRPHETAVLEVIRDLGLETHVIFNKEAVMMLPAGLNKATGLLEALRKAGLSPHNVAGIGDAENDLAFLGKCECAVAVGNALPSVKRQADIVTRGEQTDGVVELIEQLLADDLASFEANLHRHHLTLGSWEHGKELRVSPYGMNLMIAGTSGSGKSTLATGIIERLSDNHYQCCIIDPEGDYESLNQAVILGDLDHAPSIQEMLQVLENPDTHLVMNLVGLPVQERPSFFKHLYTHLQAYRARTGRPHWIVLDEAHHLLPADWESVSSLLTPTPHCLLLITVHPEQVSQATLSIIHAIMVIGKTPAETLQSFIHPGEDNIPAFERMILQPGEALFWNRMENTPPLRFTILPNRQARRRHRRKYAEGELGPDKSFFFQGPEGKLNLRAQNLMLFLQLAEGIDPDTWMFHLRNHDYSRWLRECIKDETLAAEVEAIEKQDHLGPAETRMRIQSALEFHYAFTPRPPAPSSQPAE